MRHLVKPRTGLKLLACRLYYARLYNMIEQREKNWNKRYLERDHPWEEDNPSYSILELLKKYSQKGAKVLEIGCGLGTNALLLSENGYKVCAIDISEECIKLAQERIPENCTNLEFSVRDFLQQKASKKYDVVFERGCFHSFCSQSGLDLFATKVSDSLTDSGLWISISGSSDNPDDMRKRKKDQYPRLSLRDLTQAVEPHFEVLEIIRKPFGEKTISSRGTVHFANDYFTTINPELIITFCLE